jgi:endonuclease/exonuclease/phosphatase (EEP) superfamily protein YafD
MTWSQTKPIIPPVVRIDHVLTGPGVEVTHIQTGEGVGSDHRDLIATVAFDRSGGTDP